MRSHFRKPFPETIPGQLDAWNREIWQRLDEAGSLRIPGQPRNRKLPEGLCQNNAAAQRNRLKEPCRWIAKRHRRGTHRAYWVTVVLPEWMYPPGQLTPDAIVSLRRWSARRLRDLARQCRYAAIGVVDISFNDGGRVGDPLQFSVHAHILVAMKVDRDFDAAGLLRHIFNAGPKGKDEAAGVRTPVHVAEVGEGEGEVSRVSGYMGKALFPFLNHHRISDWSADGNRETRKRPLNIPQLVELLTVLRDGRPQDRFILSGFEYRGGKICRRKQTLEVLPNKRWILAKERRAKNEPDDDDYYRS